MRRREYPGLNATEECQVTSTFLEICFPSTRRLRKPKSQFPDAFQRLTRLGRVSFRFGETGMYVDMIWGIALMTGGLMIVPPLAVWASRKFSSGNSNADFAFQLLCVPLATLIMFGFVMVMICALDRSLNLGAVFAADLVFLVAATGLTLYVTERLRMHDRRVQSPVMKPVAAVIAAAQPVIDTVVAAAQPIIASAAQPAAVPVKQA